MYVIKWTSLIHISVTDKECIIIKGRSNYPKDTCIMTCITKVFSYYRYIMFKDISFNCVLGERKVSWTCEWKRLE